MTSPMVTAQELAKQDFDQWDIRRVLPQVEWRYSRFLKKISELEGLLRMSSSRLQMLLPYLDPKDWPGSDHPGATQYIIDEISGALSGEDVDGVR